MAETIERELRRLETEVRALKSQSLKINADYIAPHSGQELTFTIKDTHIAAVEFHSSDPSVATPQTRLWVKSISSNSSSGYIYIDAMRVYPIAATIWGVAVPWDLDEKGNTGTFDVTVTVFVSSLVPGTLTWTDEGKYL